jgi:uncharacterized protein (UPF0332 family)
MTDKESLFAYRWNQAIETLSEVKKMIDLDFTPRTIINRSYYAMFYSVLGLFLHEGISVQTSKHAGIISLFDREFVQKKILDKSLSIMLHQAFDDRQEFDYKDQAIPDRNMAIDILNKADNFISAIKDYINRKL